MANVTGVFVGLDAATLAQMKTDWLLCLQSIAVLAQSYSLAGRNYNKADLAEVKATIAEIVYAQRLASGDSVSTTYADFSA